MCLATQQSRDLVLANHSRQILAKAGIGWDDIQDRLIRSFGPSAYGSLMVELHRLADCAVKMYPSQVLKKMQAKSLPELVSMADKLRS